MGMDERTERGFSMKWVLIFSLILSCTSVPEKPAKYVRKDWNHWIDQDRNCLNTRAEILKKRSIVPVTLNRKGCKVKSGKWEDFYYPEIHTEAKNVDIDHLVPLKNAHISGASGWSRRSKEEFANDPDNLVITNRVYNRKKGAKGIDGWLPVNKEYACKYVKQFVMIKNRYSLELLPSEKLTATELKGKCP